MRRKLAAILVFFFAHIAYSHVVLTFPPARPMAFDYMDNKNSDAPCGIPYDSENNIITTLVSGIDFTVTWHVAYPHQGGFKIQLLELNGDVLSELTESKFVSQNDSTKLSQTVSIDSNVTCEHCVLRILRQAKEWEKNGEDLHFWSCADVTVVEETDEECFEGKCLNGGSCDGGKCSCLLKFEGERCEYENECSENSDCSGHGQCVDIGSTYHPNKVCFCETGWMGKMCGTFSKLTEAKLKKSEEKKFRKIKLYEKPEFRLTGDDKDEIEIAIRATTDSWCAIGWRPGDVDQHCKIFPTRHLLKADPDANDPSDVVEEEEVEYEEEEIDEKEEAGAESEDKSRRRRKRRKRAVVDKQKDNANEIERLCLEGNKTAAGEWAKKSFDEDSGSEGDEKEDESSKDSEDDDVDEEKEEIEKPEPEPEPNGEKNSLHPMDCMDIIYVAARGKLHRILDSYSRDRSTPHLDEWFGGTADLIAGVASRDKGIMHVRLIRKLVTKDDSDQPLLDQKMKLIWARGQTPTKFYHRPFSGLEVCEASDYNYYRVNELKYHGTKPSQRGSLTYNPYDNPKKEKENEVETGSFTHPKDCESDCDYKAEWRYRKSSDLIHFSVEARVEAEEWAGIGFSEDKKMENSDAVVAWVEPSSGKLTITDRWLKSKSVEGVALDNGPSSLSNSRGWYIDGKLKFFFTRARDTEDDNDLALTECRHFLYAWGGSIEKGDIGKHTNTEVSGEKICFGSSPAYRASLLFSLVCSLTSVYLSMLSHV